MTIRAIWQRITTSQYARALEAEVAGQGAEIERLRAENHALLNSILGIAGIPPIPVSVATDQNVARLFRGDAVRDETGFSSTDGKGLGSEDPSYISNRSSSPGKPLHSKSVATAARLKACSNVAVPLRRRSWHQISRMFEFESARKPVTSD